MNLYLNLVVGCYSVNFASSSRGLIHCGLHAFSDDFGYPNGSIILGKLSITVAGNWKELDDIPF